MAALVPVYSWFLHHYWPLTLTLTIMSIILFWRHRSNIRKIIDGTEDRITDPTEPVDMETETLKKHFRKNAWFFTLFLCVFEKVLVG